MDSHVEMPANVVNIDRKKNEISLKEILQDKEVADMFRLIDKYKLREQALYLLNVKLNKLTH